MLVEREEQYNLYGGYNPAFVRKARENQRARERERQEAKRKDAERELQKQQREARRRHRLIPVERMFSEQAIKPDVIPARQIIKTVAVKHGVSVEQILGHSRAWPIVQVRREAIQTVERMRPDMTATQIGRAFNRDHSTILYTLKGRRGK